ncbi:hypothetical protein COT72_02205 [archaeon CG10_big_fil_rev_8_21_14_0_10_43_11]|nr:MAG: hypothetical protein COT72_02205 [archaeon CG10_big_fil_rev_8_21_14_0_10_43_11]
MDVSLLGVTNSVLELAISCITFIIGLYLFRIQLVTRERKHKLLGIGFLLISIAFITKVGLNIAELYFSFSNLFLRSVWILAYSAFLLFGYTTLDKLFLDIRRYRLFALQIIIYVLSLFLIYTYSPLFHELIGAILLTFPVLYFYENYAKKRSRNALLVLLAFFGLLVSHLSYFLIFINSSLFFVDNLVRVASYGVLLSVYVLTRSS